MVRTVMPNDSMMGMGRGRKRALAGDNQAKNTNTSYTVQYCNIILCQNSVANWQEAGDEIQVPKYREQVPYTFRYIPKNIEMHN
jgi:hypothetical protein